VRVTSKNAQPFDLVFSPEQLPIVNEYLLVDRNILKQDQLQQLIGWKVCQFFIIQVILHLPEFRVRLLSTPSIVVDEGNLAPRVTDEVPSLEVRVCESVH
jgi:hypothetical protein